MSDEAGGRLAFSCFAQSALPIGTLLRSHLAGYGVVFPDLNAPLNTPEKCRRALLRAGHSPKQIVLQRYEGSCFSASAAWRTVGGACFVADPDGEQWLRLQASPVSLWSRVRAQTPIPIPLAGTLLAHLREDFMSEVEALRINNGIANPMITLLVSAQRNRSD